MTAYSQNDEQHHILAAVGKDIGRFLDIGAWSAEDKSNTRALYLLGWGGVMVEPSPEPFAGLLREYGNEPSISLICAAVGFERSMVKMHATADAVTTSSEEIFEKWKETGGFYGSFYSPVITIPEILNQFGGFEFVNIDAEGCQLRSFCRAVGYADAPALHLRRA